MAEYEDSANKLILKLVYYGPALSGKTTNLTSLHDLIQPELKGEMMVMETKNDRTLFFDLLPLGITAPSGLLVKMKLFTVPGQVAHDSTRKAVLSRADGIVFVADSQKTQGINNAESFDNLVSNMGKVGLDIEKLPLVVQFNKRDMPDIMSEEDIMAKWKVTSWPVLFSSALKGEGVIETFEVLLKNVYRSIDQEFSLKEKHGLECDKFVNGIIGGSADMKVSCNE